MSAENQFARFKDYAEYVLSTRMQDQDLVHSVFAAVRRTFSIADADVRTWCEEWLKRAPTAWAMEYLAGAIRQVRSLGMDDLVWLKKWAACSHARLYPDWIVEADIPAQVAADLLALMSEKGGVATNNIQSADDRLREIASLLVASPQFPSICRPDRAYWESVACSEP
jgi:hypothetical protein